MFKFELGEGEPEGEQFFSEQAVDFALDFEFFQQAFFGFAIDLGNVPEVILVGPPSRGSGSGASLGPGPDMLVDPAAVGAGGL